MLSKIFDILSLYSQDFLKGTIITLFVSILASIIGLIIGLLLVTIKTRPDDKSQSKIIRLKNVILKKLSNFYILFFRGTPMIVQSCLIYFGVGALGFNWEYLTLGYYFGIDNWFFTTGTIPAALIIVSINTGAYMAEILRSGIIAIDKGQYDAAYSLGLNYKQMYKKIILPQASRSSIPSLGNMLINNIKDTSILNVIGLAELFFIARASYTALFTPIESFILVSAIYLVLTLLTTYALGYLEKKLVKKGNLITDNSILNRDYHIQGFLQEKDDQQVILKVDKISKYFQNQLIIDNASFEVNSEEVVAIIGPSGSGKSTLLRCLNFLEQPQGKIFFKNSNIEENKDLIGVKIGMVFQSFNLFNNLSILENCLLAQKLVLKREEEEAQNIAYHFLKKVGMLEHANKYCDQLSGGQKQRAAIARALCMNPQIMLFDEPTSALDPEYAKEVFEIIKQLSKEGMTMLIVTHQMRLVKEVAKRVIFIENGKIIEDDSSANLLERKKESRCNQFLRDL